MNKKSNNIEYIRRDLMEKFRSLTRLAVILTVLFSTAFVTGCFESPTQSTTQGAFEPGEIDTTTNPGQIDTTTIPEDTTTVPEDTTAEPQTVSVLLRNEDAYNSNPLIDLITSTLRFITRLLGGVVSVLDVSLEVPPMALERNTQISIDIPDPNLFVYDFGPDGLQFQKPATITISYDYADLTNIDQSKIRLAWWDENAQQWIDQPCTIDPIAKKVIGPINHFSAYGLVSD